MITFNSPTIPSTLGISSLCISHRSVVSPENVTSEETLLETVSRFLDQRQPSIVFNQPHSLFSQQDIQNELVSIHQHLVSKRVPEFSLTQLSQKVLISIHFSPSSSSERNRFLLSRLSTRKPIEMHLLLLVWLSS